MKLSEITAKTKLVASFSKRLAYTTKQKIVNIEIGKTQRVSGASARPVNFMFENGQAVKIYLRLVTDDSKDGDGQKYDVFRIDINGRMIPMSGDYDLSYKPSFDASVDMLAGMITSNQKSFDLKRAKQKIRKPRAKSSGNAPMNKAQQRNALLIEAKELDAIIDNKTKEKTGLAEQLKTLTSK